MTTDSLRALAVLVLLVAVMSALALVVAAFARAL